MDEPIIWRDLKKDERNQLIAERIFGWQPIQCPASENTLTSLKWISWSDQGQQLQCGSCGAGGETPEEIEHTIVNPCPNYQGDLNAAWTILESGKFFEVKLTYKEGWRHEKERWKVCTCTINPYSGLLAEATDEKPEPEDAICKAALLAIGMNVV